MKDALAFDKFVRPRLENGGDAARRHLDSLQVSFTDCQVVTTRTAPVRLKNKGIVGSENSGSHRLIPSGQIFRLTRRADARATIFAVDSNRMGV